LRRRGFTLMEMLVALMVFSLIITAVYSLFSSGRMAADLGAHRSRMDQAGRAAIRALLADLRGAWGVYAISTLDTGFVGVHEGTDDSPADTIAFIALNNHTPLSTPTATVSESGATTTASAIEMDLSKVAWSVDTDEATDAKGLVRAKHKLITETAVITKKGEDLETIVEDVVGLRFRYYDGSAWTDTWDSTTTGILPKAVEVAVHVKMAFRGIDEIEKYTSKIYLPIASRVPKKQEAP
jgi:type II secretion system protein J